MNHLVVRYPDLYLIEIGVDPRYSDISDCAAELGIEDRVHWAGIKDYGWQALQGANVYVQYSRYSEGLTLAVMEATALELPAVGMKVGGIPIAIVDGEAGLIATPNDVDSLSQALSKIHSNPS